MGEGRITGGIALRNGEPSVKSAGFTLPLLLITTVSVPASNVGFHFIISSWKSIVKALDVNCNTMVFVVCMQSLSTPVYLIYYLHPAYMDMMFAPQALI